MTKRTLEPTGARLAQEYCIRTSLGSSQPGECPLCGMVKIPHSLWGIGKGDLFGFRSFRTKAANFCLLPLQISLFQQFCVLGVLGWWFRSICLFSGINSMTLTERSLEWGNSVFLLVLPWTSMEGNTCWVPSSVLGSMHTRSHLILSKCWWLCPLFPNCSQFTYKITGGQRHYHLFKENQRKSSPGTRTGCPCPLA